MVEPENHTLALLPEIRAEVSATIARLDKIEKRLDAMHLNGVKALRGFVGHRSMTERAMASVDDQFARLEERVAALEAQA